jgi:hypothetical protein
MRARDPALTLCTASKKDKKPLRTTVMVLGEYRDRGSSRVRDRRRTEQTVHIGYTLWARMNWER